MIWHKKEDFIQTGQQKTKDILVTKAIILKKYYDIYSFINTKCIFLSSL